MEFQRWLLWLIIDDPALNKIGGFLLPSRSLIYSTFWLMLKRRTWCIAGSFAIRLITVAIRFTANAKGA